MDGVEGSYPEMPLACKHCHPPEPRFDQHPKNMGLNFAWSSNGNELLLQEAQDRLGSEDLEGSMYFSGTGGMRPGHVVKLEPVAQNQQAGA